MPKPKKWNKCSDAFYYMKKEQKAKQIHMQKEKVLSSSPGEEVFDSLHLGCKATNIWFFNISPKKKKKTCFL